MTSTTSTTNPAANATSEPAAGLSRARRTLGLCASACVLLTANAAFAAPTNTNERDLTSVSITPTPTSLTPLTLTQGDLLRITSTPTSTPTVVVTHCEPLD